MPRYYAHLKAFNDGLIEDPDGTEWANLALAREQAVLSLHEIIGEAVKHGDQLNIEAIIITNEQGTHLAAVPIVAALPASIVGLLKHPEKVLPPNKAEEYRRSADECRRKAEDTANIDDKMSWLKLADAWLQMLPPGHAASPDLAGWPKASDEDSKAQH